MGPVKPSFRLSWLSVFLWSVWLTTTTAARADTPSALALRVEGVAAEEGDALRAAVAKELPPSVAVHTTVATAVGSVARIEVVLGPTSATVRYQGSDGRVLDRTIELPRDAAKRRELVALLISNLVQDEAAELEGALRAVKPVVPAATSAVVPVQVAAQDERPAPPASALSFCGPVGAVVPFAVEALPGVGAPSSVLADRGTSVLHATFVGSYRGSVRGASFSVLGAFGRRDLCGVDLAGLGTHVHGSVRGAQLAGVFVSAGDVVGYQAAVVTVARGRLTGGQTGAIALASDVVGVQTAAVNAAQHVEGLQVGAVNFARRDATVQLGGVNLAGNAEVQVGAINVARFARVPIGLVNLADQADAPIALVNVIRHGRTHVDALALDFGGAAGELVHGGRFLHAIQGVGVRLDAAERALPVFYVGLGGHIPLRPSTRGIVTSLDVDVLSGFVPGAGFERNTQLQQLRVVAAFPLSSTVAVVLGPTLNVTIAPNAADRLSRFGQLIVDRGSSETVRVSAGATAGLRLF